MSPEEARELLLLHSFAHPDLDQPKMETGFLGSLRPYTGLNEDNFREVMEAIRALAPQLGAEKIDNEIFSALWGICFQTWAIALQTAGSLDRNNLITPEDKERLEGWLFSIFMAVEVALCGEDAVEAVNNEIDAALSQYLQSEFETE